MLSKGNVLELFVSVGKNRENKKDIALDEGGVVEDKYYNKNIDRSVLITSISSYEIAKEHGIIAPFSTLGENLLIDYNLYHLLPGEQLQIGEVVLEISQNCTLCKSLAKVDSRLPEILKNDRGIFAKVIKGGVIAKGNNIYLLKKGKGELDENKISA